MQLYWTMSELMVLTRRELCELSDRILAVLPEFEAGSIERASALISLDNIRRTLVLRDYLRP